MKHEKIILQVKVLFISILLPFLANSQIVTIGTGTNTNDIDEATPVNISTRSAVSYIVYTRAELLAGGAIGSGEINKLGFYHIVHQRVVGICMI